MNQVALDISRWGLSGAADCFDSLASRAKTIAPAREVVVLGVILALLQVADGILTGLGVGFFGVEAEGNALLRSMMLALGPYAALVAAKTFAIAIIAAMCLLARRIWWIPRAMRIVIGIYLVAAVLPWTMILLSAHGLI